MKVHTSRLRLFRQPTLGREKISAFAAVDLDEFHVEKMLTMWNRKKIERNGDFVFGGKDMNLRMILGSRMVCG